MLTSSPTPMMTFPPDEERLIAMMNALMSTGDPAIWLAAFRRGLHALFNDIDSISVDVAMEYALADDGAGARPARGTSRDGISDGMRALERLGWQEDFPLELHHPPALFEYHHPTSGDYIGTIIFWRRADREPIGEHTIRSMETLHGFMTFLLSDLMVNVAVRRRFSVKTQLEFFRRRLAELFLEKELNRREQQVLALLMLSYSYQGIAEQLAISIDTVRKYVRSVHRKTGIHSQLEIFARYFTLAPLEPLTDQELQEGAAFRRIRTVRKLKGLLSPTPAAPVTAERMIAFLNALPIGATSLGLLKGLHEALHLMLDDLKISSLFEMAFDFVELERMMAERGSVDRPKSATMVTFTRKGPAIRANAPDGRLSASLLDSQHQQGMNDEIYHPPTAFDYRHAGEAVGAIVLQRQVCKKPISEETLGLMNRLEPFFTFLFCDLLLRHQYSEPMLAILSRSLGAIYTSSPGSSLTDAEESVLTLQFMGNSYKAIADQLGVSINTVKKHCKAINQKMGTSGISELFARYLAPQLGLDSLFQEIGIGTVHKHAPPPPRHRLIQRPQTPPPSSPSPR